MVAKETHCRVCSAPLPGLQRRYCSPKCSEKARKDYLGQWRSNHRESERERFRRRRIEKPEMERAKQRRYRERHRERARAACRTWRERNPGYATDWNQRNAERVSEYQRRWSQANPEKVTDKAARRRARQRTAPVVEIVDRLAIYERDGGRCHICGRRVARKYFTLDHLTPLACGGEHSARNLRVAHLSCNSRRGVDRIPAQLLLVA